MRIAFAGTHYSGKTALIQALLEKMPEYESFEEPYWILAELGRHFSYPPSIDEFEDQLDFSIKLIKESPSNSLFDRSPLDFLAYAWAVAEMNSEEFDSEAWESKIEKIVPSLDLIVYVPLEHPDRIRIPASQDKEFRKLVDEKLRDLIMVDSHEIVNTKVVEVTGSIGERISKISPFISI